MKKSLIQLFAAMLIFAVTASAENLPVLCLVSEDTATQGLTDLDPEAVAAYKRAGFDLHFGFYQQTTREELMRYPIVVGMIPQLHAGTEAISAQLAEDLDFFMKSGGGFILIPGPSYYGIDDFVRRINPFLNRYGVGVCNDIPMDSNPENTITQVRALAYRYLKTTALNPDHPVTRGIPFLYLPLDFSYAYVRTYTMTPPSPEWEILVTGEESCGSFTRAGMAAGKPEPGQWNSRPPFLAVRPVGKGFLALFTTASRYFIYDAFHWAFGNGLVLNEGNGLQLMTQLFSYVSRNRREMPPAPPETPRAQTAEENIVKGNLPVIQDRNEWYEFVQDQFMPENFGPRVCIDSGSITDALYSTRRHFGLLPEPDGSWPVRRTWMDIFHPSAASGRAVDQKSFQYRFDRLDANRSYQLGILLWSTQQEGARDLEIGWIDAAGERHDLGLYPLPRYDQSQGPRFEVFPLPPEAIQSSGRLILDFRRGSGGAGDFTLLAELWLFEENAPRMEPDTITALFHNPAFGVSLLPEVKTWHRGLVGARSPYTGNGGAPVAELATAAYEAGFDFLVFTDPLMDSTSETFSRLSEDCRSVTTAEFQAVPGVTLAATEAGTPRPDRPQRNRTIRAWFAGPIRQLPKGEELKNPHTLFWKFFGGELAGGTRTVGNLHLAEPGEVPPFFQRFWRGFDLAELDTPKSGSPEALTLYRELTAAGYGPQPRASGIYRTAQEIRAQADNWHLAIPTPPGEQPWPFLYASNVSSGPEFEHVSFASDLTRDGEPGNGDIFRDLLWSVATLRVSHTAEISDAVLYSGNRVVRHFRPGKTHVAISEPVRIDRQCSLYWVVKGADGSVAVTGSYSFTDERMRGSMCADNQNSICSVSRAPRNFVRDERELYLQHSYWHTGEAQGQLGVMRDARELVPRVIETGIIQLCKYVQPMPLFQFADGRDENHLYSKMSIAAASGEGNRIHYEFQMPDTLFRSQVDLSAFRPNPDGGDTLVLAELELAAEKDLKADEFKSVRLFSMGVMPAFPAEWHYQAETAPGKFASGPLSGTGKAIELPLAPFGITALTPNNLAEPLIVSLNNEELMLKFDEVNLWNCRERICIYLPPRDWKKGEAVRFAFLFGLTQQPLDSAEALGDMKHSLLDGRAALTGELRQGKRLDTPFVLDFQAENYAVAYRYNGWKGIDPVPVRIHGLNPNWSALAVTGSGELEPLPLDDDGTGMFALMPGAAADTVFGNPVVADDPELRIEFAGVSERGASFRLHNPSAETRTFQLHSNPAFEPFIPAFQFSLTLNPGAGMWVTAQQDDLTIDSIK